MVKELKIGKARDGSYYVYDGYSRNEGYDGYAYFETAGDALDYYDEMEAYYVSRRED